MSTAKRCKHCGKIIRLETRPSGPTWNHINGARRCPGTTWAEPEEDVAAEVCRQCGEPIRWSTIHGEWVHRDDESFCEDAPRAEPVPVAPETPGTCSVCGEAVFGGPRLGYVHEADSDHAPSLTPEPDTQEAVQQELINAYRDGFVDAWDAAVKATAEHCAQLADEFAEECDPYEYPIWLIESVAERIRAEYGKGDPT